MFGLHVIAYNLIRLGNLLRPAIGCGWCAFHGGCMSRVSALWVTSADKAKAATHKAIEVAEKAGVELPDLELLAPDAMPRRGLARKADGTPTTKTQRNQRFAEACGYTDAYSHLMLSGGSYLEGPNPPGLTQARLNETTQWKR